MNFGGMEIMHPWVLAALLLLVAVVVLARNAPSRLSMRPRLWSIWLRSAVFVCIILALSDVRVPLSSGSVHVVWAVDASASVGDRAMGAARELAERVGLPEDRQSWVVFARRPESPVSVNPLSVPPEAARRETNLEAALQFGALSFPPGARRLMVVFTDGVETKGSAERLLPWLAGEGVVVCPVALPATDEPEIYLDSLDVPSEVRAREPFEARAVVGSNRAAMARVEVFHDGLRMGTEKIDLVPGKNPVAIRQKLPAGRPTRIEVRVVSDTDTRLENNSSSAWVMARGEAPVLVLSDNPPTALARALSAQGFALDIRPAEGFPAKRELLQPFDAVILDQIAADRFRPDQAAALTAAVESGGLGLLALGGPDSFGAGGYDRSAIGELFPLFSESTHDMEIPSLALVLVIDRSGSMTGDKIEMAKQAAAAAVNLLTEQDFAGVVSFDGEAAWSPEMTSAADKGEIIDRIATIAPGGGTNIAAGLELAAVGLRAVPAKIKHVILLSDGISIPGDFREIIGQLLADRATLSAVALGADADLTLLEYLAARGGGRYYFTDSPGAVPQIFARETMAAARPGFREEPFMVREARRAPFLAGVDLSLAPPLLGRMEVAVRPGADLWLVGESGEPLLATWRVGLGKVAAFASDAREVWASEWLLWPGFGAFWAQTLREILRPHGDSFFEVQTSGEPPSISLLVAEGTNGRMPPLTARLQTQSASGHTQERPMEPTGPGSWSAVNDAGTGPAFIAVDAAGRPPIVRFVGGVESYPEEFRPAEPNTVMLEKLARSTAGKLNPTPEDIRSIAPPARPVPTELWPFFAIAALLLFMGDVGVRRRGIARHRFDSNRR
jgi:Ca-activated chloride channel homolog